MEILGIGLPEVALILVIVLIVLGPKDMASTAKRLARTVRTLTQSEFWRATREAWRMAQDIPTELMRETGLEETQRELNQMNTKLNQWSREVSSASSLPDYRIQPPAGEEASRPAQTALQPQVPPPVQASSAEPGDTPPTTPDPRGATPRASRCPLAPAGRESPRQPTICRE